MPQVELKEIVQDLLDGIQWCKKELPGLLGGDKVDITRYAVGGESAGGTTATMLGHLASPPPLAVLNVYGMVDFVIKRLPVTSDATTPFSPASGLFTEAQVASELANRDLSNTLGEVLDDWVNNDPADLRHARYGDHPKPAYGERQKLRRDAHDYMIARGMLWQTLFHVDDPEKQAKLFERKQREMSALLLLDDVRTYPPTYVYHGTADVLVHVSQSDRFVAKLKQKGVPVEYAKIEGGPHVCDQYEDENSDEWKQNVLPIVAFMNKYVKAL
ncbi:hypothetical protein FRB97_001855 [Tulasnella sp. 331]|nr:hypothetical protein FRB98_004222 [Tulasnella sp. 332]KAG8879236.1 hypothetical protein FRB97_001855 [Tulasnella sp. 331]